MATCERVVQNHPSYKIVLCNYLFNFFCKEVLNKNENESKIKQNYV